MTAQAQSKALAYCLLGMCCWNLIVAIDSTALSIALPTISHNLHATTTQAFWCGTSFVLCSAAFQPVVASFSDAFGRKPMLLLSLTLFTIGAIICGVSDHIYTLLFGRSVQGAGGGGLLTMTYVVMADQLTLQERHKAISLISLTWLVGTVVGPILSGGFTQHATWRWIFWINLPFCAISYVIIIFFIRSSYKPEGSGMSRLKQIDWLGSILFVGSLTSFLIAISWGGTMYAWSSWHTVTPLAIGLGGLLAWIGYSIFLTTRPMIPLRIMRNRTAAINYLGNLIQGLAQFGMLFYLPLYYQAVLSYSPTISGVALLPQCLVAGLFSAIVGIAIARTNTVKPFVLGGWTIYTLGLGLLVLLKPSTTIPQWIFINIPSGIGLGCLFSGLALATQAAAEVSGTHSVAEVIKIKAMAASLNPFFRTLGQAFGIVISQAAFTNQLRKKLGATAALDAPGLGQVIRLLPKGSGERTKMVSAFDDSLRIVWWVLFALSAGMLALTFWTKEVGLRPKDVPVSPRPASTDTSVAESSSTSDLPGSVEMNPKQSVATIKSLESTDIKNVESIV